MTFTRFLTRKLNEDYQSLSGQVAGFLSNMIHQAYQQLKADKAKRPFIVYLKNVWPKDAQKGNVLTFPKELGHGIMGKPIQFSQINDPHITAHTNHQNGEFAGMTFNARLVDRNPDEGVKKLLSAVEHEVEHIFYPGETNEDPMEYMSDEGEMRAHAREIAEGYKKKYPNMKFFPRLAEMMVKEEPFNQTHRNYLTGMKGSEIGKRMLSLISAHFSAQTSSAHGPES
jgi:hypothetical protein